MANRQGIGSLEDVERAVLEPSGTISFVVRKPEPDELRHQELLARLDELAREIAQFRMREAPPTA